MADVKAYAEAILDNLAIKDEHTRKLRKILTKLVAGEISAKKAAKMLADLEGELIDAGMDKVEFDELLQLHRVNGVLRVVLGEME